MELTPCPNCKKDVTLTAEKCPYCGHILVPQKIKEEQHLIQCPNCKKDITSTAEKCPYCGFELAGKNLKNLKTIPCPQCKTEIISTSEKCHKCGYILKSTDSVEGGGSALSISDSRDEYPFLATICSIFQIAGIINIIVSIIGIIIGVVMIFKTAPGTRSRAVAFLGGSILYFLIFALSLLAIVELIKIFVKIEFNTRKDLKA